MIAVIGIIDSDMIEINGTSVAASLDKEDKAAAGMDKEEVAASLDKENKVVVGMDKEDKVAAGMDKVAIGHDKDKKDD